MTRTENITLTVFNPETEEYEDIRARVEFSLYVGRIEPFEADEYDWNILFQNNLKSICLTKFGTQTE